MRPYEVMVIIDAGLDEEAIRATLDRATELIKSRGGTPARWSAGAGAGSRTRCTSHEGYYALIDVTAEPAVMADVDRMLTLADEVIRHKVIRLPDKVAGRSKRPAPVSGGSPQAGPNANGA